MTELQADAAHVTAALSIQRIGVLPDRVRCDVLVDDELVRYTNDAMAQRAIFRFPNLVRHACVNSKGTTFGAVIARTSLPHLLEHVVIDMLAQKSTDDETVFVGTTEWTDERSGCARVEVSMTDDLAVLRAFRDAVSFINEEVIQ